ncbi:hypothetical protein RB595_006745 [Gaeumannomyces hyphopodioides]
MNHINGHATLPANGHTTPLPANGHATPLPADLIDPRQVKLFDALEKLRKLEDVERLDIPQLIVVGMQNSGKSSVLEALVGVEFPVDNKACTRFPTRYSLRRGDVSMTASIEPGPGRDESEKARLEELSRLIENPTNFHDLMRTVNAGLGKEVSIDVTAGTGEGFCDDVLSIKRSGPDLPQLDLVDLPGLFEALSLHQTDEDKRTVRSIAETYVRNRGSVVMVIASAKEDIHNSSGIGLIQSLSGEDESLDGRTIFVITKPDKAQSFTSLMNVVGQFKFPRPAHFLRNQDSGDGRVRNLMDRDAEEIYFFGSGEWAEVPWAQKGIAALRATLKEVLWDHTKDQLQRLIPMVEEKTEKAQRRHKRLEGAGRPDRRKFLATVAQDFEQLMGNAVIGNYVNRKFFSEFDDTKLEVRYKRLRATTRALNKKFATTVQDYGKTVVIGQPKPSGPAGPPPAFIHAEIDRLYNYPKPESKSWSDHEKWVAGKIDYWREGEPRGQASSMAYWALFEYQSRAWKGMAKNHLNAVWIVVDKFIGLALAEVCPDDGVAATLRKKVVDWRVEELQVKASAMLDSLLSCHGRGNSGFHDSLVDPHTLRTRAQALISKIAELPSLGGGGPRDAPPAEGSEVQEDREGREGREKWLGFFLDQVSSSLLGTPGVVRDLVKTTTIPKIASVLAGVFEPEGGSNGAGGGADPKREMQKVIMGLYKSDIKDLVATHLIEQVEEHYELIRTSFVGYVCSLVVEHTILQQLRRSILTSDIINDLDKEAIEDIAKEKPGMKEKRKKTEKTKQTLEEVLKVLKDYNGQ